MPADRAAPAPVALVAVRLLPVLFLLVAAAFYVFHTEGRDAYPWRNVVPFALLFLLAADVLRRGGGRWAGAGWHWPLALIGAAIPCLGLSLYLHYGYAHDLNGMYSEAVYPEELFRFLPMYTVVAGALGFAIGWRVGRNVSPGL